MYFSYNENSLYNKKSMIIIKYFFHLKQKIICLIITYYHLSLLYLNFIIYKHINIIITLINKAFLDINQNSIVYYTNLIPIFYNQRTWK